MKEIIVRIGLSSIGGIILGVFFYSITGNKDLALVVSMLSSVIFSSSSGVS